ncbi:MAG TPA: stage II sporulation protein M [Dehalococcoidia bacterium]|nr:stage II sporulation protein M [Dehalococcoidia bacterium]
MSLFSYKWWIFIAIFLFGAGLIFGFVSPTGIIGLPAEDMAAFEELSQFLASLPLALIVLLIFIKNASVLLISFVLSPMFCLVPILALTVNGWVIAFVSATVIQEESLGYLLAGLLPHGIFELPAFILGEAAALSFGAMAIVALFRRDRRNLLLPNLKRNFKYLMIALALLLPAAIIETFVTPLLLT